MSIESLIKRDSSEPQLPQTNPSSSLRRPSLSSQTIPFTLHSPTDKGRRKRTTSILSPEGITIRRSSPGKRGRVIHFPKSIGRRPSLLDNTQDSIDGGIEKSLSELGEKKVDDDNISESGWISEGDSDVE